MNGGPGDPLGFVATAADAGERLDRFLTRSAEAAGFAFSRTRLKALIEAGDTSIDGVVVQDPSRKLFAGARITVTPPPPKDLELEGEDIPLAVVYEDADLIVIDKPAKLVVHPAPGHATGTLVQALIAHCGSSLSGIGGVRRPGIVHRLDKDTSGLMVVAKTDAAHRGLAEAFADHGRSGSLQREYLALCWGGFEAPAGTIDAPLGRHPHSREKMAVVGADKGRFAVTHWRVVEAFPAASAVRCRLMTGRTHQIRVHLAHIGHPLIGDFGLRRRVQDQGHPADAAGAKRVGGFWAPGAARRHARLPAPRQRRDARVCERAAQGLSPIDESAAGIIFARVFVSEGFCSRGR